MATSKDIDYGLLVELSYVNFRDESLTKGDAQTNSNWLENAQNDIDKSSSASSERKEPLKDLLSTYEIVDFKSTSSGMQALLLKDSSGHYTIAYRGTETNFSGLFQDLLVADI
ncbi:MAG: hypothetical protein PHX65_07655, partial [Sulfurimonas sp.]|nr:hypothetical protein [Sulfurimonas sp.]